MITTINFNELFPPDDFKTGREFAFEYLKKQDEDCSLINKRIKDLTSEFYILVKKFENIKHKISLIEEIHDKIPYLLELKKILIKIEINRDLRKVLSNKRCENT